jgi:hypothetical protein
MNAFAKLDKCGNLRWTPSNLEILQKNLPGTIFLTSSAHQSKPPEMIDICEWETE